MVKPLILQTLSLNAGTNATLKRQVLYTFSDACSIHSAMRQEAGLELRTPRVGGRQRDTDSCTVRWGGRRPRGQRLVRNTVWWKSGLCRCRCSPKNVTTRSKVRRVFCPATRKAAGCKGIIYRVLCPTRNADGVVRRVLCPTENVNGCKGIIHCVLCSTKNAGRFKGIICRGHCSPENIARWKRILYRVLCPKKNADGIIHCVLCPTKNGDRCKRITSRGYYSPKNAA